MYINIFCDKKNEFVYIWDDCKGMVTLPMKNFHYAYRQSNSGKYKSMYGDKLEKTFNFNPRDPSIYEGDVPMETVVLRDLYEESDEPSKGNKVVVIDIEVDSEGNFPIIEKGDKEITAISLYDKTTDKYYSLILDKDKKLQDLTKNNIEVKSYVTEVDLLHGFLNKWEEISPTIVSHWNGDSFDMPYMFNRISVVLGSDEAKRLSPIHTCYMNKFNKKMVIAGISSLDYMLLYKKFIGKNRPSYALGEICKLEVGMDKIHYTGSLNTLYNQDIQKYVDYNVNDVKLVVALDEKFKYIELAREICHVGHVPYEWFAMSSRYLEGAVLMDLRRHKLIAPNKPVNKEDEDSDEVESDEDEETFSGAYVKSPIPGRYDWIYDLDLSSMYPNIIISLNISPETKINKIKYVDLTENGKVYRTNKLKKEYLELSDMERRDITEKEYISSKIKDYDPDCFVQNAISNVYIGESIYSLSDLKELLTTEHLSLSSNGVMYYLNEQGVIPKLLSSWFKQRKDMRKLSKKYHEENNKELEEYYDRKQYSWKIMLNSMYGTLGLKSFRFYDVDNAESVTKTGVTVIKTTAKIVNQYYNNVIGNKYLVEYTDGTTEIIDEDKKKDIIN